MSFYYYFLLFFNNYFKASFSSVDYYSYKIKFFSFIFIFFCFTSLEFKVFFQGYEKEQKGF